MGVLGPDGNPVKCVAIEEVGCECVTMEEAVCGGTDINTAVACALDLAERLLGAVAIFAISRPSSPNRPWSLTTSFRRSWISSFTLFVEPACLSESDSDSLSFRFPIDQPPLNIVHPIFQSSNMSHGSLFELLEAFGYHEECTLYV